MPAELLLPLFAVVLAVNALFVGLAIRSLWRSRDAEPRSANAKSLPVRDDVIARSIRERGTAPDRRSSPARDDLAVTETRVPGDPPDRTDDPPERTDDPPERTDDLPAPAGPEPERKRAGAESPGPPNSRALREAVHPAVADPGRDVRPEPGPRRTRRAVVESAATATPTARRGTTPSTTTAGSRRRFALPPLDEDHERVRRSIETFLGGDDTPSPAVAPDQASLLTVAVIGLAGPERSASARPGRHPGRRTEPEPQPTELRAMLERTVRSTARGTDVISIDRHGRVRVILPGTGELAAHAYLRRIRAIVDPIAEAAIPPSRVVVATATDLDGSVASARRRADRRFAAALVGRSGATPERAVAEPPEASDELIVKPRAAGD